MNIFKSRTFWVLVVTFVLNGFVSIHDSIPASILPFIDGGLMLLATYFHINPRQSYGKSEIQ